MSSVTYEEAKRIDALAIQDLLNLVKTLPPEVQRIIHNRFFSTHVLPACMILAARVLMFRKEYRLLAWMCEIDPCDVREMCDVPQRVLHAVQCVKYLQQMRMLAVMPDAYNRHNVAIMRQSEWKSPTCACAACLAANILTPSTLTISEYMLHAYPNIPLANCPDIRIWNIRLIKLPSDCLIPKYIRTYFRKPSSNDTLSKLHVFRNITFQVWDSLQVLSS
jgi:hypothetical protein